MYTFRETVDLGPTNKSMQEIRDIVQQLKQDWPGGQLGCLNAHQKHVCMQCSQCSRQQESLPRGCESPCS